MHETERGLTGMPHTPVTTAASTERNDRVDDDRTDLQRLLDTEAIRRNVHEYARGIDRRDWDLVRSTFHPDAQDDHGPFKGDIDGLVDWVARRHAVIEQSMHVYGHIAVDFLSSDVAVAEAYEITLQRYSNEARETIEAWVGNCPDLLDDQRLEVAIYARTIDRVERRHGAWKTARREVVLEQVHSRVTGMEAVPGNSSPSVRGPEDAIYRFLGGI